MKAKLFAFVPDLLGLFHPQLNQLAYHWEQGRLARAPIENAPRPSCFVVRDFVLFCR
jgi:hypothetical protein